MKYLDEDDYPTDEALTVIRRHPADDLAGLMEHVRACWIYEDYWREEDVTDDVDECPLRRYHVATGGWSGHEDAINALSENYVSWSLLWVQSNRGGKYIFERPL